VHQPVCGNRGADCTCLGDVDGHRNGRRPSARVGRHGSQGQGRAGTVARGGQVNNGGDHTRGCVHL